MLLKNYRSPENLKEVYSLFERENYVGAFIWQNHGLYRDRIFVQTLELKRSTDTLHLHLESSFTYDINNDDIYIYLPFRETVCKAKYLSHHGDRLMVLIPESIKTLETRTKPRFKFRPSDEKFVTLRFAKDTIHGRDLKFPLIDISESGLAICMSHQNKELLNHGLSLVLTHLGKIPLPKPIPLKDVYLKPFKYKFRGKRINTNRVGLQMNGVLKRFVLEGFAN